MLTLVCVVGRMVPPADDIFVFYFFYPPGVEIAVFSPYYLFIYLFINLIVLLFNFGIVLRSRTTSENGQKRKCAVCSCRG